MRFVYVFIILLLVLLIQSVSAQEMYGQAPCAELTANQIPLELPDIEFIPTCELGFDCMSEKYFSCEMQIAAAVIEPCEEDDLLCQNLSLLGMVSYAIDDELYGSVYGYPLGQGSRDNFPQVLAAVQANDFETALSLLPLSACFELCHPLLPYSRALIYELANQAELALQEYDLALSHVPHHLISHYGRGLLLGRLGRSTEASFESQWLTDYFTAFAPALLTAIAPLTEAYPFDSSRLEHWKAYPLIAINSYGGDSDLSQNPARAVQIAVYPELNTLFAIDMAMLLYPNADSDIFNSYRFEETEANAYLSRVSYGYSDGFSIQLEMHETFILAHEQFAIGEAGGRLSYILVDADAPDPRLLMGERPCEGGVISRLRVGSYATAVGFSSSVGVSSVAGGETSHQLDNYFTVLDNPVCIGNVLWWELEDSTGIRGWHPENEGNDYLLNPQGRYGGRFLYCPAALPPRLLLGRDAIVIAGMGANNLRAAANSNAEVLAQIPENTIFHVSDGPVCSEGRLWWEVTYNEIRGWTAEGDGETYWLEPVVSPEN